MNRKPTQLFSFLLALLLALTAVASAQAAPAYIPTTWTVTKTADTNDGVCDADCSLREAIAVAVGGDTVVFDAGLSGQSIYLGSTLIIGKNLTIDGSALASKITVSGDTDNNGTPDVSVFKINAGFTVTLDSLIVKKGRTTDHGAGIYNDGGTLTVTNSLVTENVSTNNAGGIYNTNSGVLTVSNSAISNNSSVYNGGGIHSSLSTTTVTNSVITGNTTGAQGGGGIRSYGGLLVVTNSTISNNTGSGISNQSNTLQVSGSTFSGNSGVNYGGGIFTQFSSVSVTNSTFHGNTSDNGGGMMLFSSDSVTVKNSTFSNNTANAANTGGGIYNYGSTLYLVNTIIANSPSGGDCRNAASLGANTNNLYEDSNTSCGTPSVSGDPNLGALADNGGSTLTMELLPGSPAINAGDDASCAASPVNGLDQRGITRPQGAHCDIGAYEAAAPFDTTLSNSSQNENTAIGTAIGTLSTSDPDPSDTHTYSFCGGADDASFSITGNALKNAVSFDYEVKSSYSVCVRTTDSTGLTYDETHSISVGDINEAPIITSDGGGASASVNVAEHSLAVTTVAASDLDTGASLSYSIIGGADEARFSVNAVSGALAFVAAPNFEVPNDANVDNVYEVTVQVSDGGLTDSQAVSVTVTNILEVAPTNISLSNNSLAENLLSATAIGTLTSTDADLNDTFAYSFCGGADDAAFQFSGDALQSNAAFNFEAKSSYAICVRSTDSGGQFFNKNFTVNVTNVNEAATNISLSNSSVAENLPVGTTVGALTVSEQDAGDSHTLSFCGGADDAAFTLDGAALKTAAIFDRETKSSYAICLRATDTGSLAFDKNVTITVTNVNEPPVITSNGGAGIANVSMAENTTAVTTVVAVDPDAGATLTYSISGGWDAAKFSINPTTGVLTFIAAPNFEAPTDATPPPGIYGVVVLVMDASFMGDTQSLNVTVTNVNEAPTAIALSNSRISENLPIGTIVGALSTTDPDAGGAHAYSFCGGADDASFTISGSQLRSAAVFDFDVKTSYAVCLRSTDNGGLARNKNVAITVTNAAPQVVSITRLNANPTASPAVVYLVTFNEPVTGVGTADFALAKSGSLSGVSVTHANMMSPTTYQVRAATGTGSGNLRLEIPASASITDGQGLSVSNLPFTTGQAYALDREAPIVFGINRLSANPTSSHTVLFNVQFSEPVAGVSPSNFSLVTTGSVTGASITGIITTPTCCVIAVNTGTGSGTLQLNLTSAGSIQDASGNPLSTSNLPFLGMTYTIKKSLTFTSLTLEDGHVVESSETSGLGGGVVSNSATIQLGDDVTNRQYRGILAFNTASLPDTAVITKITLKIKQQGVAGINPFSTHGLLLVDIINGSFSGNPFLEASDFQATSSMEAAGSINNSPVNGWHFKVWNSGPTLTNINRTGFTQFRLRFATDDNNNSIMDVIRFYSGNSSVADTQPILIIEYYIP